MLTFNIGIDVAEMKHENMNDHQSSMLGLVGWVFQNSTGRL